MLRLALLSAALIGMQAAPMDSCSAQGNCIQMNIFELPVRSTSACTTGTCQYQACLILDYSLPCAKDGAISHICQKSNDICGGGDFRSSTTQEIANVGEGYQQCQTGSPGQTLFFLMKDGNGCAGSSATITAGTRGLPSGSSMKCGPTKTTADSCTGNPIGMECVWQVTLPSACQVYVPPVLTGNSQTGTGAGTVVEDDEDVNAPMNITEAQACGTSAPCQNGGRCVNGEFCECTAGHMGFHCETLQCNNVLANYPGHKVLDGGMSPSCSLGEAAGPLGPYDCVPEVQGCNILKCNKPVPPEVINGIRQRCPDTALGNSVN